MEKTGYYEIGMNARNGMGAFALVGNVIYNRLHWHDHLEVMCCLKGQFCMRIEGEICTLKEGDLMTVNCGCAHEIFDGTEDGLQIIFSIDASLLKKKEEEEYEFGTTGPNALSPACGDVLCFLENAAQIADMMTPELQEAEQAFKARENGTGQQWPAFFAEEDWYRFYICLYRCLFCLARHKREKTVKKENHSPREKLRQCIRMIHRDYGQTMDARILAERMGISQPTIYRMFQKQLGVSLNDYIRMVRVHAACAMMEQGTEEVAQIAFACGFSSISNFYQVFRRQMGQTPGEYRSRSGYAKNGLFLQKEFLDMNRFQNFYELPYTKEDLKALYYDRIGCKTGKQGQEGSCNEKAAN